MNSNATIPLPPPYDTKSARDLTHDEAKNAPFNYPCMLLVGGRHYHSVGLLDIPRSMRGYPFGGDLHALFWRYDSAPPNEWVLTFRFRYNKGPNSDPREDRKSFYACKIGLKEGESIETEARAFFARAKAGQEEACGESGRFSYVLLDGDAAKAAPLIQRQAFAHIEPSDRSAPMGHFDPPTNKSP